MDLSPTAASIKRPATVPTLEFVVRASLAAVAVVLCYQFRWDFLRFLTAELNLRLDALAGLSMHRSSFDTVLWRGESYRYVIACTFADVWCGAVPLLSELRRPVIAEVGRLLGFGIVLIAFNAFRLSVSDVLFAWGVPWDLAHGLIGGLAYFAVFVWIWSHKSWRTFRRQASPPALTPAR